MRIAGVCLMLSLLGQVVSATGCRQAAGDEERERAIDEANRVYAAERAAGRDFSAGPCLREELIPGWVLDIAHDPRQPVDELPANQCQSYRAGRTSHFVELDPDGNLIRAK